MADRSGPKAPVFHELGSGDEADQKDDGESSQGDETRIGIKQHRWAGSVLGRNGGDVITFKFRKPRTGPVRKATIVTKSTIWVRLPTKKCSPSTVSVPTTTWISSKRVRLPIPSDIRILHPNDLDDSVNDARVSVDYRKRR